jgi:hypothetical protein
MSDYTQMRSDSGLDLEPRDAFPPISGGACEHLLLLLKGCLKG